MSRLIDLSGKTFGRLTVVSRDGTYQRPSGNKEPTWRCRCECGQEVVVTGSNLKRGNTLSCGCKQRDNRETPRRETAYRTTEDVAYVSAYGGVEFIVSKCDVGAVLSHRWRINARGYIADEHGNTVHRFLMSPPSEMDVHHINGNKLDNRRSNLLMLTRAEHVTVHHSGQLANGVTVQDVTDINVGNKMTPTEPLTNCQQWIPVTERLPESGKEAVMIALRWGEVDIGWCEDEKWGSEFVNEYEDGEVTHWMPLPSPPERE